MTSNDSMRRLSHMCELGICPTFATLAAGFGIGPGLDIGVVQEFALESLSPQTSPAQAAEVMRLYEATSRHDAYDILLRLAGPIDRKTEIERWACTDLSLLLPGLDSPDLENADVAYIIHDFWDDHIDVDPPTQACFLDYVLATNREPLISMNRTWLNRKLAELRTDSDRSCPCT